MFFGNKSTKSLESLKDRILTKSCVNNSIKGMHNETISFILPIQDLSNLDLSKDLIILSDGLIDLLINQEYIVSLKKEFITSFEIYLYLPDKLRDCFYYYKYANSSNSNSKSNKVNIFFLDLPIKFLDAKNLSSFIDQNFKLDGYNKYFFNILDFETRFMNISQKALKIFYRAIDALEPIERDQLYNEESGATIRVQRDVFSSGFSTVEFNSVMANYQLITENHSGAFHSSYAITPFSNFNLFKDKNVQQKLFYSDHNFTALLKKSIKRNDFESIYHLLGHYNE
jgi:hypothetical protein